MTREGLRAAQFKQLDASHAAEAVAVAQRAIRRTEGSAYTSTQVEAWLRGMTEERFRQRLSGSWAIGAFERENHLNGFATFVEDTATLDYLFVDPDAWRQGLGSLLVSAIEDHAQAVGACQVRVDASLLARPLFESLGYELVSEYQKEVRGVLFENAWLVKTR